MSSETAPRQIVSELYEQESRRIFATLVRLLGDFDLAEEAMHDAFAAAVEQWEANGVPAKPRAWIVSAARFKAIDALRRKSRFEASLPEISRSIGHMRFGGADFDETTFHDDHLRLIFTCCHPALPPNAQVALT